MKISVKHIPPAANSYRACRVQSLFNAEDNSFEIGADLPIEGKPWKIGVIVGPSGSGKTTIGQRIFGHKAFIENAGWGKNPIIDEIAPEGDFNNVTGALAAVGLGTVPAWLRPYNLLSNGEQFRATLAKILVEAPEIAVLDEFTSVVDRQIAKIAASAFAKAWRRNNGQIVLLTCHYDVLDWLEPDWVLDTTPNIEGTAKFTARWERQSESWYQRPKINLEIRKVDGKLWTLFKPHYYLDLPRMIAADYYAGFVDGEPVAHVCFAPRPGLHEARASRLVIMPEWQGAGIGIRFLNAVCDQWEYGNNRYKKPMRTLFHTSHPGLAAGLRRDKRWIQISAVLHGENRAKAGISRWLERVNNKSIIGTMGGHFRAVQGFRYLGGQPCE